MRDFPVGGRPGDVEVVLVRRRLVGAEPVCAGPGNHHLELVDLQGQGFCSGRWLERQRSSCLDGVRIGNRRRRQAAHEASAVRVPPEAHGGAWLSELLDAGNVDALSADAHEHAANAMGLSGAQRGDLVGRVERRIGVTVTITWWPRGPT